MLSRTTEVEHLARVERNIEAGRARIDALNRRVAALQRHGLETYVLENARVALKETLSVLELSRQASLETIKAIDERRL